MDDFYPADLRDKTRDVYHEPVDRALIRTEDVYETETEIGTVGYSDKLIEVIANYTNSGRPEGYNAECMVGKSKRGEVALKLYAVVNPETHVFEHAGFRTRGCLAVTACASVICTMIEGKTFDEALAITTDDVKEALDGVPSDKAYTPVFAIEGVRALIGDYYSRQGATLEELDRLIPCNEDSLACILCENCSLRTTRVDMAVDAMRAQQEAK